MEKSNDKKKAFGFMPASIFGRTRRNETKADHELDKTREQETVVDDADESRIRTEDADEELDTDEGKAKMKNSNIFFDSIANNFLKLANGGTKKKEEEETISNIVASVREQIEQGETEEIFSLTEIIQMLGEYKGMMSKVANKYVGSINLRKLSPTAVMYYLEREDEVKNPSWKRRQHRFCPGINIAKVHELNDFLDLAQLCYAATADAIRDGLANNKTPYDLVYVNVRSSPGQPANFVAVKRDQSSSRPLKKVSPNLRVIIGVRGTASAADAITDLLCDTVDYKGGKAHSFILESGKYVAEKHRGLLEELRVKSGKKKVKVTLIGHSLGAGAASIAGMELHNTSPKMDVQVIGFGCPALVSNDLAEKATYITTVVNDADLIPRMSGNALANLLLDIMAFDWMPYAKRDIQYSLDELHKRHSAIFRETTVKKILQTVEPLLERHLKGTILTDKPARLDPEVYPPGRCIHFYRDGSGISDHVFHSGYQKSLLEIARQALTDHHFRFDG